MVTDEMVEKAAAGYWNKVCGVGTARWPDAVPSDVQDIFREGCRAAIEASLSAAEPVAYVEPTIFETLKAGGSGMFPISNSKFKGKELSVPLYAAPPAPSVAVKALQMADETFRDLGWHDKYEATTAALTAISAQVQDDEDNRVAISLGAAVLSKIVDPAARETAIRNALVVASNRSAQVQDGAAKSLADAYQKYLDASHLYNERLAILKSKALGTMRVDEERKAIDEARRAFDKLAIDIAKSALPAAPAKQEGKA